MSEKLNNGEVAEDAVLFKQNLGILLCVFYALAYAGFVVISIYDVTLMDKIVPFGLNLAAFYGVGLIVLALVLAMIYSVACTTKEITCARKLKNGDKGGEK